MKKSIIILVGCPGSGKTTWAKSELNSRGSHKHTVVLCQDDIRAMMWQGNYHFSRANESIVTKMQHETLANLLTNDFTQTIIIADTNLNPKTRQGFYNLAKEYDFATGNTTVVTERTFDIPWVELEKRNLTRGNEAVPIDVLRSMYKNMRKYMGDHTEYIADTSSPKAVIFDIDGTLADNGHRSPFDLSKLDKDTPKEFVVNLLNLYKSNGYKIICLSGRHSGTKEDPTLYYHATSRWLIANNIHCDELHLRNAGDHRKDDIIKEEIFWNDVAPYYNVEVAVDDRQRVVEMWRRIGVNCFSCDHGDF